MKSFRDIRVIPVVLVAIFGLAVLKVAGLVIDGGYVFDYQTQPTKKSWAQDSFNFPGGGPKVSKVESDDITGSVHGAPEKKKEEAPKPAAPAAEAPKPDGVVVFPEQNPQTVSASERAIARTSRSPARACFRPRRSRCRSTSRRARAWATAWGSFPA